jgi:hypothetical protein
MTLRPEPRNSQELLVLTKIHQMLAEAKSLDEIKRIRDKAVAAQRYVQSARLGLELQNEAAELRLCAERKAGALLAELHLRGGDRKSSGRADRLKLEDLGLNQNQSKRWQRVAAVPERDFVGFIREAKRLGQEISSAKLLRAAATGATSLASSVSPHSVSASHRQTTHELRTPVVQTVSARNVSSTRLVEDVIGEADEMTECLDELAEHLRTMAGLFEPLLCGEQELRSGERRVISRYFRETNQLVSRMQELLGSIRELDALRAAR